MTALEKRVNSLAADTDLHVEIRAWAAHAADLRELLRLHKEIKQANTSMRKTLTEVRAECLRCAERKGTIAVTTGRGCYNCSIRPTCKTWRGCTNDGYSRWRA
jgi:thiamine biosynthesis lipoprotein ApbE